MLAKEIDERARGGGKTTMWREDDGKWPGTTASIGKYFDQTPLLDAIAHDKIIGLANSQTVLGQRNDPKHIVEYPD